MKSLAELAAIREKMQSKVILREGSGDIRVVVGMATGVVYWWRPGGRYSIEETAGIVARLALGMATNGR